VVFEEFAGRYLAWERALEGWKMWTESEVVNNWPRRGESRGELKAKRESLVELLQNRFPDETTEEVVRLVMQQDSLTLLRDWSRAAALAATFDEFLAVLRG